MIPAQGPLSAFRKFHDKRTLVVGQGKLHVIAEEYPFESFVTTSMLPRTAAQIFTRIFTHQLKSLHHFLK